MDKTWKQFRIWATIVSVCILALGVAMIIWPSISAVVVCCLLGVLCITAGVYELIRYFKMGLVGVFFRFDLTLGISSILIGLLLLIQPDGAVAFLPIAVGLYIMMCSVFNIQLAVEMYRYEVKSWWVSLILGIVGTVFSMFLFLDPFDGAAALMIFVGLSLVISSIQGLYLIFCISKTLRSRQKETSDGVIYDVEWTSVD